jgi:hypothetical protein
MNIVERAKNILLQPKQEWVKIDGEATDVKTLYTEYIIIMAAIPAIAGFIGLSLVGASMFGTTFRVPIVDGLVGAIVRFVMTLAGIYIWALIIDALAPTFGGTKNRIQALKVSAYSYTAAALAGIFTIIPALGMLGILGLYSIYLLYTGLPILMKAPQEKAMGYTVVVILLGIVLGVVIAMLAGLFMPTMSLPR